MKPGIEKFVDPKLSSFAFDVPTSELPFPSIMKRGPRAPSFLKVFAVVLHVV